MSVKSLIVCAVITAVSAGCAEVGGSFDYALRRPFPEADTVSSVGSFGSGVQTEGLYYELDAPLSKYEPREGLYVGADVGGDLAFSDFREFEGFTGISHGVYGVTVKSGEYPLSFVLRCVSSGKTPFITITPSDYDNIYDVVAIEETAKAFGSIKTPMFILFYPYDRAVYGAGIFPEREYVAFYRAARDLFAEYCPDAAFVWGCAVGGDAAGFYPGDEYADWVCGTALFAGDADVMSDLTRFYYVWQRRKPIMLSAAVSHHGAGDGIYRVEYAAETITELFGALPDLPRIKAVIYQDGAVGAENCLVTDDAAILESYAQAVASSGGVETDVSGRGSVVLKSAFRAVTTGGITYVPKNAAMFDLGYNPDELAGLTRSITLNGETFYSATGGLFVISDDGGKLLLRKSPPIW